jgi:hypothetical protein
MMKVAELCFKQNHSWNYQKVMKSDRHTLKIDIRRNAYDEQSHARVERWSGTKWELVWEEPITACECKAISYTADHIDTECFRNDAGALMRTALDILGK